jgi:hypothetical protein
MKKLIKTIISLQELRASTRPVVHLSKKKYNRKQKHKSKILLKEM